MYGAFQGAAPRITPYGSLYTSALRPSSDVMGMLPAMELIRPATSRSPSRARCVLNPAQRGSEPVSLIIVSSRVDFCSSSISAARIKISRLWGGGTVRHAGYAV